MAHPTDFAVNDRITTVIGDLTVMEVYSRLSADVPIEVDVTPDPSVEVWDTTTLTLVLRAESARWMSSARHRCYRLNFQAHSNVAVVDDRGCTEAGRPHGGVSTGSIRWSRGTLKGPSMEVILMDTNTDVIECKDHVTVDHWRGEFEVAKVDAITGSLYLVGDGICAWVPPSHAHRVVHTAATGNGD